MRLSHCKINLLLNILGRRPDGFHEVETIMQPLPLHDRLDVTKTAAGIELSCNHPQLPVGPENLVFRAAAAFFQTTGLPGGVRIYLEKNIPLAAGLGGGSGNAATTLLALNELFGNPLDAGQLQTLAANLGSDVPFFLQPHPALATGRGEKIQPLQPFASLRGCWVILVHPGFGIPTAWAYKSLAKFPEALEGRRGRATQLLALLQRGDLEQAGREFYNALEFPALKKYPLLALFQEFFRANGAVTMMSGSGSTTFAIVRGRPAAENLLARFKSEFGDCYWTVIVPLESAEN